MHRKNQLWGGLCALLLLTAVPAALAAGEPENNYPDAVTVTLSDDGVLVDRKAAPEADSAAVYTAHDIIYYETGHDFTYGEGTEADEHTPEEAAAHTVVHIARPGTYVLQGTLSQGQIAVDLGQDAKEDPDAVVTLVLDGADVTCSVAPAVIFYNVYECDPEGGQGAEPDLSGAGARVIIADGTVNRVAGSYVARIYKSYTLNEDGTAVTDSKKLHKYDGAFYSKMSMTIDGGDKGDGVLDVAAENEGLDTEMHLTLNGGNIRIASGNDGVNVNEDGVSVVTINGGSLDVTVTGGTGEGDGVDSNGYLVINGGSVTVQACSTSADAGLDAEKGVYINGGAVAAAGSMLDPIEDGGQTCAIFTFSRPRTGGGTYTVADQAGDQILSFTAENDFSILLLSDPALTENESYTLLADGNPLSVAAGGGMGMGMGMAPGAAPEPPDGTVPNAAPEPPNGADPGNAPEPPDGEAPNNVPEPPNGADPGNAPEPPDGAAPEPPDRTDPGNAPEPSDDAPEPPGGMGPGAPQAEPAVEAAEQFTLPAGVNYFQVQ